MHWEGPDAERKCKKIVDDYENAATNWFIKCKHWSIFHIMLILCTTFLNRLLDFIRRESKKCKTKVVSRMVRSWISQAS